MPLERSALHGRHITGRPKIFAIKIAKRRHIFLILILNYFNLCFLRRPYEHTLIDDNQMILNQYSSNTLK